jgi:indolepyruvate decarboxylase
VIFSDTNFALSHRRLDPRRNIIASDRVVRIGHHVYPDLALDDLIEALLVRARLNSTPQGTVRPPAAVYQRNLPADDEPVVATAINDLFGRHGVMPTIRRGW